MSWKPEVQNGPDTNWYGNVLRFASREEAEAYAHNLMMRWTLVTDWRVVESKEPINYVWTMNGLKAVEEPK